MRIPLHPGGIREMLIMTLLLGLPGVVLLVWAMRSGPLAAGIVGGVLVLLWLFGLAFFRDFERTSPAGAKLLLAPADGTVVETLPLEIDGNIGGPATRLSIFLSVFNVHVNRSPCSGTVRSVQYQPGRYLDARDPKSGQLNEANTIVIDPDPPHAGPIVVRQIAGLVARRIVCTVKPGDRVSSGHRIGLIKFGSRTELIVPGHKLYEVAVKPGDAARGALTVMAHRTQSPASSPATQADPVGTTGESAR